MRRRHLNDVDQSERRVGIGLAVLGAAMWASGIGLYYVTTAGVWYAAEICLGGFGGIILGLGLSILALPVVSRGW